MSNCGMLPSFPADPGVCQHPIPETDGPPPAEIDGENHSSLCFGLQLLFGVQFELQFGCLAGVPISSVIASTFAF